MSFLRRAVAGVWNLLKPADATSNPVIEAIETTEKEIDLVIEKREGLIRSTAAETLARDGNTAAITAAVTAAVTTDVELSRLKGRINKTVVQIRGHRGKNQEQAQPEEMENLNAVDGKIDILVIANDTAAVANNNNAEKSNKLSNDLDTARGLVLHDLTVIKNTEDPAFATAVMAAQAASRRIATLVPEVIIASKAAVQADEEQYQANNKLNEQKYKCLPDVVFEYNEADRQKLIELRQQLIAINMSTSRFQDSCVADSAVFLSRILKKYSGWSLDDNKTTIVSQLMMATFTESWAPYLNPPADINDTSVNTNNRIFYNRVTSCLDALDTYSIFSSSQWAAYKTSTDRLRCRQIVSCNPGTSQLVFRDPVRAHVPPAPPPPPGPPTPADSYYDEVVPIGPYRYVIGPILDFQNIEGRIFIYIKCYDDPTYTTGTYFWVYRSQSEGLYRVFFKLRAKASIEKGYDYTQATLVHFKLQIALNKYYDRHAQRGGKNPIIINTLSRLNYFVGNMSYLQDVSFLDTFPNRANIIPSFYSIPGEANPVWFSGGAWNMYLQQNRQPTYCDRARQPPAGQPATECCYVCLIPPPPTTPPGVRMGMIGHYYTIDARFEPIIHMGFPMNNIYSGMREIKGEPDYLTEVAAYFPDRTVDTNYINHINYTFSRHDTQYDTTYPYIFCFTTCCLITPCAMFDLFLDPERYKKTFWCQGFQDFTTLLADPANPIVCRPLSPVLHVVIGSMLSEPDFYLSGFRYSILNVNPSKQYPSTNQRLDEYKKSTQIFMTLETIGETVSIYQPSIDPYPRYSALKAFKSLRDKINEVNIQYERRLFSSTDDDKKNQRLLVEDKVETKIKMIQFIACIWYSCYIRSTPPNDDSSYNRILELLTLANGGTQHPNIIPQINELYAKTGLMLLADPNKGRLFQTNIISYTLPAELSLTDLAIQKMILNAHEFILVCPSVAATAIVEYVTSAIKFKEDLIDYALLCLKKNWLGGMMDNAYQADTTVFGDIENRRLYYLNDTGVFVYMGHGNFTCLDPSNPANADLYVHKSSFDEVKTEGGLNYSVTVLTLANIYRLDCYYKKMPGNIVKSMSIVYQVSSTIVYTRVVNPQILNAIDMQKIPLTFLPDLPEVIAAPPIGMVGGGNSKKNAKPATKPAAKPVEATVTKPLAEAKQEKNPKKAEAAKPVEKPRAKARTTAQQEDQIIGQVSFLQSQQHQLQGQLVTEITNLQTRQVYIENEAIQVGLTSVNLPALSVLHGEVAGLNTYLQLLQTQQTPDVLIEIQTQVTQQKEKQQQLSLIVEIAKLQTRQVSIESKGRKLGVTTITLPELQILSEQMVTLLSHIELLQTQLLPPEGLSPIHAQVAQQEEQQKIVSSVIQETELLEQQLPTMLGPIYSFLFSEYTSCATHRRIASYGAFFAGKMMEYFFDQYIQLPSFFKYFDSYLKYCVQYSTTALIYDADVPPYNLIQIQPPLTPGAPPPRPPSFTLPFSQYFQKMGIVLVPGSPPDGSANAHYILATLQEKTSYIKAISDFLTKDFMKDTGALDDLSRVRSGDSFLSASSASSARSDGSMLSQASESTTSSDESRSFCSFGEGNMDSDALRIFLSVASLDGSQGSDVSFRPQDDTVPTRETNLGEIPPFYIPDGGNKPRLATVATTKRNRKYKTRSSPKRKSKSNNKSKSRHKRNSKITNKTFCRKRKSYLSRKPHKKQTLKKGVKR